MTILYYKLTRFSRPDDAHLCEAHVAARRVLGWKVLGSRKSLSPRPACEDCGTAKDSVLEATIAVADAAAAKAAPKPAPKPAPILPGQRQLPGLSTAVEDYRRRRR